jgi:hypothetical protein
MRVLEIRNVGVIQEGHTYCDQTGAYRAREAGLVFATHEGLFFLPCSSLEKSFRFLQVDEHDLRNREALGILP